jgi:multicomponent Na+:H+ antiporter subunit E
MLRTIVLFVDLLVLWLLLSGIFTPLLLTLGFISCLATTAIIIRMRILNSESLPAQVSIMALPGYLVWLLKEIAKANWAVTKIILSPRCVLQQKLFNVPNSQTTDVGKVIFANSITLTPGTITVETEHGYFVIHALTEEAADLDALADMDRRVSIVENKVAFS